MDQQTLRSLLEQLHQEISVNPPTDNRSRELLLNLQRDIEQAVMPDATNIAAPSSASKTHPIRERVQEAAASYEGTHPQAAAALERVMTLLSNFGL